MLSTVGRSIKFKFPLIYHKIFPPKVKYKGFSIKTDEEFNQFVQKRLDHPLKNQSLNWLSIEKILENRFSLLDLGCGPGVFPHIISRNSEMRDRIQYTGVDQSSDAIAYCKKTLPGSYNFICRDIITEGLPAGNFDVVALNEILEHIYSYDHLISEVLVKNPKIIIVTSFGIIPEYKRDRKLWRTDTECYMNSYSFSKFYSYLKEKIDGTIFIADYGTKNYERHWFPLKTFILWYVRSEKKSCKDKSI